MIVHVVCFKYKADTAPELRQEHTRRLHGMAPDIHELTGFEAGPDFLHTNRSYDAALVARFADRAGLEAYAIHPSHVPVAEFGRAICSSIVAVDFETE